MENIYENTARLYDADNRDNLSADIPFYLEFAGKQNGDILELGCGTGRVALVLAAAGFHVAGLDLSEEMLRVFREKLSAKPELSDMISLVHGDMSNFCLDRKFALIIAPFRAFQAVTDDRDIDNALSCIRKHLVSNGIFIVNVFNPNRVMDQSWCYDEQIQWECFDENTGNYIVKRHRGDKIDTEKRIIYPHFSFEVTYPDGKKQLFTDDLKLKYYDRVRLRAVIEKAGMEITEEYSWYDKTPPDGREIIFICRRKRI